MTPPRYFRHFKGKYYKLLYYAHDCETDDRLVVYKALYGDGKVWVRPEKNFFEEIERDGKKMPRFTEVDFDNIEFEKPFTLYGVEYPDPSFMEWHTYNMNDIPLKEDEIAILRKGYEPDWDHRFTIHAYKQNIYIIRSGVWIGKIIYRKGDDGLYHIAECYSNRGLLNGYIINDVMTCRNFETDAIKEAYIRANRHL